MRKPFGRRGPPGEGPHPGADDAAHHLPLLTLGLLLGGGLFGLLLLWARAPSPPGLDAALLRALRTPGTHLETVGPSWFAEAVRDITALGSNAVVLGLALLVGGALWLQRRRALSLFPLVLVGGAQVLANTFKVLVERARPGVVPHLTEVVTHSFPSAHATLSACLYPTLALLLARRAPTRALGLYFVGAGLLLALLVGASRVLLGVHYPSDVVAGWVLGGTWAAVAWRLFTRFAPAPGEGETHGSPER